MEETIRNGCVATKLKLTNAKKDVKECIRLLLLILNYTETEQMLTEDEQNTIKLIILYRQCQQMQDDLFNAFLELQVNSDRLLASFRNCLTRIHNTVKYRTAIAIEHIFVSLYFCIFISEDAVGVIIPIGPFIRTPKDLRPMA